MQWISFSCHMLKTDSEQLFIYWEIINAKFNCTGETRSIIFPMTYSTIYHSEYNDPSVHMHIIILMSEKSGNGKKVVNLIIIIVSFPFASNISCNMCTCSY